MVTASDVFLLFALLWRNRPKRVSACAGHEERSFSHLLSSARLQSRSKAWIWSVCGRKRFDRSRKPDCERIGSPYRVLGCSRPTSRKHLANRQNFGRKPSGRSCGTGSFGGAIGCYAEWYSKRAVIRTPTYIVRAYSMNALLECPSDQEGNRMRRAFARQFLRRGFMRELPRACIVPEGEPEPFG